MKKPDQETPNRYYRTRNVQMLILWICSHRSQVWERSSSRNQPQWTNISTKKHQEVIFHDKQCQETKLSVCEGKKWPSTRCSDRKPAIENKDVQSREPATKTKSSLCRDRYCQSTRCFKKATRCSYTKSPEKPICGDDKNCQSPQFMRPEKPNNAMWLKHPVVNTRKMQSDPEKRQQMKVS